MNLLSFLDQIIKKELFTKKDTVFVIETSENYHWFLNDLKRYFGNVFPKQNSELAEPQNLFLTGTLFINQNDSWIFEKDFQQPEYDQVAGIKNNDFITTVEQLINRKNSDGPIIVIPLKKSAKLTKLLEMHNATRIELPDKILLHLWIELLLPILNLKMDLRKKNALLEVTKGFQFEGLDEVCNLLRCAQTIGNNNLRNFIQEYKKNHLESKILFELPKYLLYSPNRQLFLKKWLTIKDAYPIQFWTVFFSNQIWRYLKKSHSDTRINNLCICFAELYQADLMCKQSSLNIQLEPILLSIL